MRLNERYYSIFSISLQILGLESNLVQHIQLFYVFLENNLPRTGFTSHQLY